MDTAGRERLNGLMVRLADGDRTVFDEVYSALWPVISTFCSRTLPQADAEDAAQQALFKIFDQAIHFERDRDVVTWALSIAMWEVRTIRKRNLRARTSDLADFELPSAARTPEMLAADRQITGVALDVLGQLSVADRETLLATFNDEAPEGVAGATFRKRRERALARLKLAWRRVYAG